MTIFQVYILFVYDAASLSKRFPTFRDFAVVSSFKAWKVK